MKINILIIYILLKYYIIIRITITIITPYPKIKLPSAICHLNLDIIIFDFEKNICVRTKLGMNIEKTGNMISTWKKRHYVVQMADGSFEKVSLKPQNNE